MHAHWQQIKFIFVSVINIMKSKITTLYDVHDVVSHTRFVALEVCRLITFVAYDVCRLIHLSHMMFVA